MERDHEERDVRCRGHSGDRDGPTPSTVAVNGETYLPADGEERVEGYIQWGDLGFVFLGWVSCMQMPKAYGGPVTLILHPRDTETSDG